MKDWVSLFMAVFALLEEALVCGARAVDVTMSPPIAAAPSVPSRNNGNSSSRFSSASSCDGCLDGGFYVPSVVVTVAWLERSR